MKHLIIVVAILMVAMLVVAGCTNHQASGQKNVIVKDTRLKIEADGCWFDDGVHEKIKCTEEQVTQAIAENI
ncbi:MAG: hypothetical protein WC386_02580 [Candidatus Paceibacterota bacterium]|jgi:hypothetical protein